MKLEVGKMGTACSFSAVLSNCMRMAMVSNRFISLPNRLFHNQNLLLPFWLPWSTTEQYFSTLSAMAFSTLDASKSPL